MKLTKISKNGDRSLYAQFLTMTILPLVVSGILMMVVCTFSMKKGMSNQVEAGLSDVAQCVLTYYDITYPGDYSVKLDKDEKRAVLYKGDVCISDDFTYVDDIKLKRNLEISIIYADERLVTTVVDPANGERALNSAISNNIKYGVYDNGSSMFVTNAQIGSGVYYAYYEPIICESDNKIVGMIGVAKSTSEADRALMLSKITNLLVMALAIGLTVICILIFANRMILVIKYMIDFMKKLSANELDASLNEEVTHRTDEFGIMGRILVDLQISLRRLIERDVLTGLYNRRSAEKKLDKLEKEGITYSLAIGDIDHFKAFNDNFGHECGDVVLKEVALTLNDSLSGKGFAARWGGEEFLLVFENMSLNEAFDVLIGIREDFHDKELFYKEEAHKVTMTFGLAQSQDGLPINQLIRIADDKLYEGKQGGRDRVMR